MQSVHKYLDNDAIFVIVACTVHHHSGFEIKESGSDWSFNSMGLTKNVALRI